MKTQTQQTEVITQKKVWIVYEIDHNSYGKKELKLIDTSKLDMSSMTALGMVKYYPRKGSSKYNYVYFAETPEKVVEKYNAWAVLAIQRVKEAAEKECQRLCALMFQPSIEE